MSMKVLKFGAVWCKECLVMRPIWEEIEANMPNLKTEYFDADLDIEAVEKYKVKNLPIFIFLDKNNNEISRLKGIQNKEDIIKVIKANIDK